MWSKESTAEEYARFLDSLLALLSRGGQFVADAEVRVRVRVSYA